MDAKSLTNRRYQDARPTKDIRTSHSNRPFVVANVTPFLLFGSQTVVGEHRGDVPSRADVLSGGVTPFTMTGSGSGPRSE